MIPDVLDIHPTTRRLYDAIGRGFTADDARHDYTTAKYLDAGARDLGVLDDLVRDSADGPGWSSVFDVDRVSPSHLPWLAMFSGVRVPESIVPIADRRQYIRNAPARRRGRPTAIAAAIAATLVGPRRVRIIERDESAWHYTVVVYAQQTPDPALTEAVARSTKPGALRMTFEIAAGGTYAELDAAFGTYADQDAAFVTYDAQRTWVPA